MELKAKDSNGTELKEGDSVILTKTLKVKGSPLNLKKGEKIKNIRLTESESEIECRVNGSTIVLKTEFLKKA